MTDVGTQEELNNKKMVKQIIVLSVVLQALIVGVVGFYFRDSSVVFGLILGHVIGLANFIFLTKVVVKLVENQYKGKTSVVAWFVVKVVFLFVSFWLAFWVLKTHVLAFTVGYFILVLAIIAWSFLFKK